MSGGAPYVALMGNVSTPCVNICRIDPRDGLCEGCARTPAEIAHWLHLDEAARSAIIALAPERRAKVKTGMAS